jgi:hypothetical protein
MRRGNREEGSLKDALKKQLEYQEKSTRCYRILGSGDYDYGVTFNADMGIFFNVSSLTAVRSS